MKKLVLTLNIVLLFAIDNRAQQSIHVVPLPVSVKRMPGSFTLTRDTRIRIDNNEETMHVVNWLKEFLSKVTGYDNPVVATKSGRNVISLSINENADTSLGDEGYKLSVKPDGSFITANKGSGLFHGVQTLIQLFPKEIESQAKINNMQWSVPAVEITDYPRFGWRGLMLDVSRHFFTVDEVKKLIDEMARYKFNLLHLHLTDDNGWRIEIKSFPNLTKTGAWRVPHVGKWKDQPPPHVGDLPSYGGFYTQEEIKFLVQYARQRSIDILPEIDVPGHSLAAIASYPYLSCTKLQYRVSQSYPSEDNALCLGNDSTYEFLDKVFSEIAQLFPYPYIHIGGDECEMSFWEKCEMCRKKSLEEKLSKSQELQGYFARRVEKIVASKGKKIIGWDEIVEGGLSPNATVMSYRGMNGGIEASNQHHNVVMSPDDIVYLDVYQGDPAVEPHTFGMSRFKHVYEFEPVPAGVDGRFILGGQGNLWTESVPTFTHVEYMIWPRSFAISEALWSPANKRNWSDFVERTKSQLQRFSVADINYSTSMYDAIITKSMNSNNEISFSMDTEIDGLDMYYTWDNTYPNHHSPKYAKGEILSVPGNAALLRVVTYENGKLKGKMITVPVR